MFNKYIIIVICIVIAILVLYFVYDEISSLKKIVLPVYQKTMILEKQVFELTSKNNNKKKLNNLKNNDKKQTDTQVLSISYQSDLHNSDNKDLSIKYKEMSDTEANNILSMIRQCDNKLTDTKTVEHNNIKYLHNKDSNVGFTKSNILPHYKNEFETILEDLVDSASTMNLLEKPNINSSNKNVHDYKVVSDSLQCVELPTENTLSSF